MQYFEASDDKLERIGKVIGDALAALVVLCVIILASGLILFLRARCDATLQTLLPATRSIALHRERADRCFMTALRYRPYGPATWWVPVTETCRAR
jgi:hypothetical protein